MRFIRAVISDLADPFGYAITASLVASGITLVIIMFIMFVEQLMT